MNRSAKKQHIKKQLISLMTNINNLSQIESNNSTFLLLASQ
jgi:hypothetical protein